MISTYRCDRCKREYAFDQPGPMTLSFNDLAADKKFAETMDLCGPCSLSFKSWRKEQRAVVIDAAEVAQETDERRRQREDADRRSRDRPQEWGRTP